MNSNFIKELTNDKLLGVGSLGKTYAIKGSVVKYLQSVENTELSELIPELLNGVQRDHPRLLGTQNVQTIPKGTVWDICISYPKMEKSLRQEIDERINKQTYFSKEEIINCIYTIAHVLCYLKTKHLNHRSIRPSNILFDKDRKVYLTDYGNANLTHLAKARDTQYVLKYELQDYIKESKRYLAPEMKTNIQGLKAMEDFFRKELLFIADSWSLGIVMLEVCLLRKFIPPAEDVQLLLSIESALEEISTKYGTEMSDLMRIMLSYSRFDRANAAKIVEYIEEKFSSLLTEKLDPKCIDTLLQESKIMKEQKEQAALKSQLYAKDDIPFEPQVNSTLSNYFSNSNSSKLSEVKAKSSPVDEYSPYLHHPKSPTKSQNIINGALKLCFTTDLWEDSKAIQELMKDKSKLQTVDRVEILMDPKHWSSDWKEFLAQVRLMAKITSLSIRFETSNYQSSDISQDLLLNLEDLLTLLTSMNEVELDFSRCCRLPYEGIEILSRAFALNKKLSTVKLIFKQIEGVSDKNIGTLLEALSKISSLTSLTIDLSYSTSITNEGIQIISEKLQKFILEYFSLNLIGCSQISQTTIQTLKKETRQIILADITY